MQRFSRLLANAQNVENVSLIDIRAPYEWADTGVVSGAFLIPLYGDDGLLNEKFIDSVEALGLKKDAPLHLICHSGRRTLDAAAMLARAGYKFVASLDGGVAALMAQNYPLKEYKDE